MRAIKLATLKENEIDLLLTPETTGQELSLMSAYSDPVALLGGSTTDRLRSFTLILLYILWAGAVFLRTPPECMICVR